MATPLMIEIAMFYYCRGAGDYGADEGRMNAPAVVEQAALLVSVGILKQTEPGASRRYEATEAAKVWLDAICSVPFPVQQWVIPS